MPSLAVISLIVRPISRQRSISSRTQGPAMRTSGLPPPIVKSLTFTLFIIILPPFS